MTIAKAQKELDRALAALKYSRDNELIEADKKRTAMLEWNANEYAKALAAAKLTEQGKS